MTKAQLLKQLHGQEAPGYAEGYEAGLNEAFDGILAVNKFDVGSPEYGQFLEGLEDAFLDA